MRHPLLLKTTAWIVLVFFPVVMSASAPQGMLQAQGAVTVNGRAVSNTATLFPGDRIQTGANSVATLSSQGVMVQMEPNTTAIYDGRSLDLGCGSAMVATSVGTMVRVAGITVAPGAQNMTKIFVSQTSGTVKITARDNWAVVNDGHIRQTIAPGQSVTFSRPNATCEFAVHTMSQGSSRVYLPAAGVMVGLGVLAYCASNGFCSEASPSVP